MRARLALTAVLALAVALLAGGLFLDHLLARQIVRATLGG